MYVPLCPPRFLLLCCRPFSLFVISLQLLCVRLMHSSGITAEDEGHIEWVKRPSVTNNAHILSPSTTLQSDGGLHVVYWTEWFCLHKVLHIFVFTCKLKREISLKIIQYSILTSINYFQDLEKIWFVGVYGQILVVYFFTIPLRWLKRWPIYINGKKIEQKRQNNNV